MAAQPGPATLAGARMLPAGRLGEGWLLAREPAGMAPPVPAREGAIWDGRFRLSAAAALPDGAMLGPLGLDSTLLRESSDLPAAILFCLPAVRLHGTLVAVPHLRYRTNDLVAGLGLVFQPVGQVAGAAYVPAPA